jgi:Regulator of ribonuclease activity B
VTAVTAIRLLFAIAFLVVEPVLAADDLRAEVVQQLQDVGSDVSRAHKFDFYLYVPRESDALAAARALKAKGLVAVTRRAAKGTSWLCLASVTLVPDSAKVSQLGVFFKSLAAKHKGEFDGWEAALVR